MLIVSIALFSLAVLFGLWLVVLGLRYQRSSSLLAIGHISAALLGFGLLLRYIFSAPSNKLYNDAALLFFLALCGGLVLLALRISKREYRTPPPLFVVVIHALMAIAALWVLIAGYTPA